MYTCNMHKKCVHNSVNMPYCNVYTFMLYCVHIQRANQTCKGDIKQ